MGDSGPVANDSSVQSDPLEEYSMESVEMTPTSICQQTSGASSYVYAGPALRCIPWFDYSHVIFREVGDATQMTAFVPARVTAPLITSAAPVDH